MTQAEPEMKRLGVAQFGISVQDSASKAAFCKAEGLEHTLLADVSRETSKAYGVLNPAGVSNRVTFIISPDGKVARRIEPVNVRTHGEDLVAALKELQSTGAAPVYRPRTEGIAQIKPGDKAPDFALPNTSGTGVVSLKQILSKPGTKAVALIWVSLSCPVSQAYEGRMKQIAADFKPKGVEVLGIASNSTESAEALASHFRKSALGFPVLLDASNTIADAYGARVTPEAYLVNRAGVVIYHGAIDDSQEVAAVKQQALRTAISDLVAGKSISVPATKAFGCSVKRIKKDG